MRQPSRSIPAVASVIPFILLAFSPWATAAEPGQDEVRSATTETATTGATDGEQVVLQFKIVMDTEVYGATKYKKPPQIAIWIEDVSRDTIRTLFVTGCVGKASWNGKSTCPVALPYWVGRYNLETDTKGDPTKDRPVADAITQPTPTGQLEATTSVLAGSVWLCFVEVNASGDFSNAFPEARNEDQKDRAGNGQPSLVYHAQVDAITGRPTQLKLIGRTLQLKADAKLIPDVSGITTAKKLLSKIEVSVVAK